MRVFTLLVVQLVQSAKEHSAQYSIDALRMSIIRLFRYLTYPSNFY